MISTQAGQSGSPLILVGKNKEELSVIAIHKGGCRVIKGNQELKYNVGRMLTK